MSIPGSANPLFIGAAAGAAAAYQIDRSVRLNSSDSSYFSRTPSFAGDSSSFTFSCWFKGGNFSSEKVIFSAGPDANNRSVLLFSSNNLYFQSRTGGSLNVNLYTSAVFRDPAGWLHIVLSCQSGSQKIYINGTEAASATSTSSTQINTKNLHAIGCQSYDQYGLLDAYLAEVYLIDGQALAATDFGEYDDNNVWQPKAYGGNYDTPVDQSATWSNLVSTSSTLRTGSGAFAYGALSTIFDGDLSTGVGTTSGNLTLSFSSGISTSNSTVEVYVYHVYSATITAGGNTYTTNSGSAGTTQWVKVTGVSGTITQIAVNGSGSVGTCGGIKIDGKLLVDSGLTANPSNNGFYLKFADNSSNAALGTDSSGQNNTFTVHNLTAGEGKIYSSGISIPEGGGFLSGRSPGDAFDGSTSTFTMGANTSTSVRWTYNASFGLSGAVEIYPVGAAMTVTFDDGRTSVTAAADQYTQISSAVDFTWFNVYQGAGLRGNLAAIKVGGVVLADNDANTSQTWSSSSSGYHAGAGSAFDGNLTTSSFATGGANANAYVDITAINASKVEVYISAYGSGSAGAYYYCRQTDGTQHTYTISSSGTSLGWITVYDGSQISINRLGGARNSSGAAGSAQYGWKVDGVLLVNSGTAGFDPSGIDSLIDTPTNYDDGTNVGGNYCTLNPLTATSDFTASDGNLKGSESVNTGGCLGTMAFPSTGKWYFEVVFDSVPGYNHVGIATAESDCITNNANPGYDTTNEFTYWQNGSKTNNVAYGDSFAANDVIGVAFDADAESLVFYKNGVSQGVNATGLSGTYFPFIPGYYDYTCVVNFGQRAFAYPVSGYKSLCTTNLPEPLIPDPSTAFDVALWAGNSSTQTISGLNLSPDFLWIKVRSNDISHYLGNTVAGINKNLESNNTAAEVTNNSYGYISATTSDGFSLTSGILVNGSGKTYVGWAWDAGTSTVSNTDGSITSQVRASQTNGISIATYTGTGAAGSVGHGLNSQPHFVIIKNRDTADAWYCQHVGTGLGSGRLRLNTSDANSTAYAASYWNSTAPTNSVVNLGTSEFVNGNGEDLIMYCFTPVNQFSSFGSYVGNGSADGPFVFTGMRPRWIMIKASSSVSYGNWVIHDTTRSTFNVSNKNLYANLTNAEDTTYSIDILSNGFKIRSSAYDAHNGNNKTYTYLAFATHPLKTARAR